MSSSVPNTKANVRSALSIGLAAGGALLAAEGGATVASAVARTWLMSHALDKTSDVIARTLSR